MQIILDTHILIWYLEGNEKLSKNIIDKIENSNNEIFISIASIWEIAIKINLKKLQLNISLTELRDIIIESNINLLSITFNDILINSELIKHHSDPFDRIIISQSINNDYFLISNDRHFELYKLKLIK